MTNFKISIIGLGFVGSSMYKSFKLKGYLVYGYDKYKLNDTNDENIKKTLEECLDCDIIFLALPTLFNELLKEYDKSNIKDVCKILEENKYMGLVVIKSTVEPTVTNFLASNSSVSKIGAGYKPIFK